MWAQLHFAIKKKDKIATQIHNNLSHICQNTENQHNDEGKRYLWRRKLLQMMCLKLHYTVHTGTCYRSAGHLCLNWDTCINRLGFYRKNELQRTEKKKTKYGWHCEYKKKMERSEMLVHSKGSFAVMAVREKICSRLVAEMLILYSWFLK